VYGGGGRFPYPNTEHIKRSFDHIAAQGAIGAAERVDRFCNHAAGTLNWSNVYSFSRLARQPTVGADDLLRDYAVADFGVDQADFIVNIMRRLYAAGQQILFIAKERGTRHSNLNVFTSLETQAGGSRATWDPGNVEAAKTFTLLNTPTPEFITQIITEKMAAMDDLRRLAAEVDKRRASLTAADFTYLTTALERSIVVGDALTTQHTVMLMVRHDVPRPTEKRRYTAEIAESLARLRHLASHQDVLLRDLGNEGNQYNPERLEYFCRNAERHLDT